MFIKQESSGKGEEQKHLGKRKKVKKEKKKKEFGMYDVTRGDIGT